MNKLIKRVFLRAALLLFFSLVLISIAFIVSPWPSALIIRKQFSGPVQIKDQKYFDKAKKNVNVHTNLTYNSTAKNNFLDVYTPKKLTQQTPILIWVHGGGYVGGDKSGMKEFATRLVSDTNVVFVSMNYETAPSAIYPSQLKQVNEVVEYLKASQEVHLNTEKIILGGDSAGAQIALQYALVQTNKQYAHQLQFKRLINENQIIGAISYCGPVDLEQVTHKESDSFIMKWFVNTVAWSELGQKNWQQSNQLKEASLVNHLTNQFPPTYITDGNAYSFQEQGWAFKQRLEKLSVPVDGLFFKNQSKKINHEYQFNYDTQEAKECYRKTVDFVESIK